MTGENRRANAEAEMASALEALRAAEALLSLALLRDAMSRAYYAVFHAARALLLLEGLEAKTHAGVLRFVATDLVRTGKLDARANLLLAKLHAFRQASDYAYAFDIAASDAGEEIAQARAFVEAASSTVGASSV